MNYFVLTFIMFLFAFLVYVSVLHIVLKRDLNIKNLGFYKDGHDRWKRKLEYNNGQVLQDITCEKLKGGIWKIIVKIQNDKTILNIKFFSDIKEAISFINENYPI